MAASLHGDTPYSGKTVTSVPATPYTTSVDVNACSADQVKAWLDVVVCPWRGLAGAVAVIVAVSRPGLTRATLRQVNLQLSGVSANTACQGRLR